MALSDTQQKKRQRRWKIIIASFIGILLLIITLAMVFRSRGNLARRQKVYSTLAKGASWKSDIPTGSPPFPPAADFQKIFKNDSFVGKPVKTFFLRVNKDKNESPVIFFENETKGNPLPDKFIEDFLNPAATNLGANPVLDFKNISENLKADDTGLPRRESSLLKSHFEPQKDFITVDKPSYLQHHAETVYLLDPKSTFGHTKTCTGDVILYEYWWGEQKMFSSVKELPKCVVAYVYCLPSSGAKGETKYSDIMWWSVEDACDREEREISLENHVVVRKAFSPPKHNWPGS